MRAVINSPELWRKSTVAKARKEQLTAKDITDTTATMAITLLYSSVQRPSAVAGLMLRELEQRTPRDGVWVMSMADHKTAAAGPARLSLDQDKMSKLLEYVTAIRPHIDESEKVLLLPGPAPIQNVANLARRLEQKAHDGNSNSNPG